jgi:Protein of unknown function (DUF4232)
MQSQEYARKHQRGRSTRFGDMRSRRSGSVLSAVLFALTSVASGLPISSLASASATSAVAHTCTAADLAVKPISAFGVVGTRAFLISLKNISVNDCTLKGYPRLRLVGANGTSIATYTLPGKIFGQKTVVRLVRVKPRWSALFDVTFSTGLNYSPKTCPISEGVVVGVPMSRQTVTVKWRIRPFGGPSIEKLRCGELQVSPVYGPYLLTPSELGDSG